MRLRPADQRARPAHSLQSFGEKAPRNRSLLSTSPPSSGMHRYSSRNSKPTHCGPGRRLAIAASFGAGDQRVFDCPIARGRVRLSAGPGLYLDCRRVRVAGMFACGGLWSGVPAYLSERFPEDGMAATAGKLRTLRLFRHWQHPHRRCSSGCTVSQPGNRLRPATDRDCLKHELRIAGVRDKLRLLLRSGGGS